MKNHKNNLCANQPMPSGDKPRIMVYIDGLNLYYSIVYLRNKNLKWLDIGKFIDLAVRTYSPLSQGKVEKIKYFTTLPLDEPEKKKRHQTYIRALERSCEKIQVIYGRAIRTASICKKCGYEHNGYEEKETDVSLACAMLKDAYEGKMDMALIVSGDGDFVPPIMILQQNQIKVFVASMPKQPGFHIEKSACGVIRRIKKKLKKCILPDPAGGISKPPEWSS